MDKFPISPILKHPLSLAARICPNLSKRPYWLARSSSFWRSCFLKVPSSNPSAFTSGVQHPSTSSSSHLAPFLSRRALVSLSLSRRPAFALVLLLQRRICQFSLGIPPVMATATTACASTAFAGQTVLKQVSELSSKVGNSEARVQMRGSKAKASSSIWSVMVLSQIESCFLLLFFFFSFFFLGGFFFPSLWF